MSAPSGISQTHSIILNLIRFLCSQGVVFGHLIIFFGIPDQYFPSLASYCVLMFFVLSGFLISFSLRQHLTKNENYSFWNYFRDRFFRIYPPFIAALVLVFVLDLLSALASGGQFSWSIYFFNFVINSMQLQEFPAATFLNEHYMIEFFRFHYFGTDLPLWTISIEWWLYMFYGFFVFYILRNKKMRLTHLIIFVLLSLSPLYYLFISARMEKGLTLFWFLGVVLSYVRPSTFKTNQFHFYFNLLVLVFGMFGFFYLGYNSSIVLFFLSLFALFTTCKDEMTGFNHLLKSISTRLSGYSYSLYLIHYPLICFVVTTLQIELSWINFVLVFLSVNIIAFLFAEIFEKNSKKLKLKYENYRSLDH
jgi:peptidoglycan/LPS O-acetylase OafA/YrhL